MTGRQQKFLILFKFKLIKINKMLKKVYKYKCLTDSTMWFGKYSKIKKILDGDKKKVRNEFLQCITIVYNYIYMG